MQTYSCHTCKDPISPLGSFVKVSGQQYHLECYLGPVKEEAAHQARVVECTARIALQSELNKKLEEIRILRRDQPLQINKEGLIVAIPAPAPALPPIPRADWDAKAEKLISGYIANYGPMFSKEVLRGYLHRLYKLFVETELITPVDESKPGPTLDEWLKRSK